MAKLKNSFKQVLGLLNHVQNVEFINMICTFKTNSLSFYRFSNKKNPDDNKWIKFPKSREGFLKIDLLKACTYCYHKFIGPT